MNSISKIVLEKIKKAKMLPIPKWRFAAMHILLWAIVLISIILGSIAISVILRSINGIPWEVARMAGRGPIHSFILVLPYIWIGFLALILFTANNLFAKTEKSYRYKPILVVAGSVLISLLLGIALYFAGAGHVIERGLINNVRPYADWQNRRDSMMVAPDRGILIGKVMQISPKINLIIIDLKSTKWTVDVTQAKFKNDFVPQINLDIGVLGNKTGKDTFKAERVMLWKPNSANMFNGFGKPMRPGSR